MKHLYLVRHAKSSWKETGISDIDRPLNERGKRDAPFMGKILRAKNVKLNLILCSTSKRTRKTASAIAEELDFTKDKIVFDENIYEASSSGLMNIIREIDDKYDNLMIIGHNPGLTLLQNNLSDNYIDNIPTCGIVALKFNGTWKNLEAQSAEFDFFEYPKLHFK